MDYASFHEFRNKLKSNLNWFLDVRSLSLDAEGDHRPLAISSLLSCCYRQLPNISQNGQSYSLPVPSFDISSYLSDDAEYRQPIIDLHRFLIQNFSDYISHVLLVGSLATLDYSKGWSDIDAVMIVKHTTLISSSRLHELRQLCLRAWPYFLAVTPLQHHGFIVITEYDLANYQSSYMPVSVLEKSIALFSTSEKINFNIISSDGGSIFSLIERRDCVLEAINSGYLRHHPYQGVYLKDNYLNARNGMYQLFCMLGYIMTVPSYLLDGLGRPCYKSESFDLVKGLLSERSLSIISKASIIRKNWETHHGTCYELNEIPHWVQEKLGIEYFKEWYIVLSEAVDIINDK